MGRTRALAAACPVSHLRVLIHVKLGSKAQTCLQGVRQGSSTQHEHAVVQGHVAGLVLSAA